MFPPPISPPVYFHLRCFLLQNRSSDNLYSTPTALLVNKGPQHSNLSIDLLSTWSSNDITALNTGFKVEQLVNIFAKLVTQ